jgi:hypothetical protein
MATSLAPKRDLKKIFGFAIHHSAVVGAKNIAELTAHANSYDKTHSFRDYNGDGKNDAQYTGGELGWKWLLYHWMIARDGSILKTQKPEYRRYHASDSGNGSRSFNEWGLGILLDGNFETEYPTEAQLRSASKIIYDWEIKYGIDSYVRGHREVSITKTSCPGKNMGTSKSGGVKTIIDYVNQRHKNGGLTDLELKEKQEAENQPVHEAPTQPETPENPPEVIDTPVEENGSSNGEQNSVEPEVTPEPEEVEIGDTPEVPNDPVKPIETIVPEKTYWYKFIKWLVEVLENLFFKK